MAAIRRGRPRTAANRISGDGDGRSNILTSAPGGDEENLVDQAVEKADKANAGVGVRIVIPKLDIQWCQITLRGDSGLIVHAWSKKARDMMANKQQGKGGAGREKKDPEDDYRQAFYSPAGLPKGKHVFPVLAFKSAAVEACTSLGRSSISKVAARQSHHVYGTFNKQYTFIEGAPHMREDMVRVSNGQADIRYRPEFEEWTATLRIRYNARVLSPEQIVNLYEVAGFGVGVGDWRVEKNGDSGMFHVERQEQIEVAQVG